MFHVNQYAYNRLANFSHIHCGMKCVFKFLNVAVQSYGSVATKSSDEINSHSQKPVFWVTEAGLESHVLAQCKIRKGLQSSKTYWLPCSILLFLCVLISAAYHCCFIVQVLSFEHNSKAGTNVVLRNVWRNTSDMV